MSGGASGEGVMLRAFVAVELPPEILDACGRIQDELAVQTTRGVVRWVRREGIHLTLRFLGDTPTERVADLEHRLRAALAGTPPLTLRLAPLGVFPNASAPRVVWIGLAGDLSPLGELQRRVDASVTSTGFPPEGRPFSPHLTLGRVVDRASLADRQALGILVGRRPAPPQIGFEVGEVCLIRSELSPGGARYSRLFSVRLGS